MKNRKQAKNASFRNDAQGQIVNLTLEYPYVYGIWEYVIRAPMDGSLMFMDTKTNIILRIYISMGYYVEKC